MEEGNPFQSRGKQCANELGFRYILIAALAAAVLSSANAPVAAAELAVARHHYHTWAGKHIQRVAYMRECRTGWWQYYWDGVPYPRWGTRCI